jgi:endonuclease/exonuclease/phosphatase family metal-dependent hydrolase
MAALAEEIDRLVPHDQPLIIAGDFNDWRNHASEHLARRLDMVEVFDTLSGKPARSFPVAMPMLRLDRIYIRGLKAVRADVHYGAGWSKISDHAALRCELALTD